MKYKKFYTATILGYKDEAGTCVFFSDYTYTGAYIKAEDYIKRYNVDMTGCIIDVETEYMEATNETY